MKALVAMSGGVDSSVAAALMLERGYETIGATLKQWEGPDGRLPINGCCTVADAEDARSAAARLGIRHYVLDYTEQFRERVVEPFGAAYLAGLTPNPCIECNRRVRFSALLDRAGELDCDLLVTGHHARLREEGGRFRLMTAADPAKDQSYVLHMLDQDQLRRIRFPVGEMTKAEVRAEAARLGLRVASKPDSQDLCFIAGDYREFLEERYPGTAAPGPVTDASGRVVGEHRGTSGFTIGQRRGLGIATGRPSFVVDVVPSTRTVVIGDRDALAADGCRVEGMTFVSGRPPADPSVSVRIRYRSAPAPARLSDVGGGVWEAWFDDPVEAVAPGQAAVAYRGDEVVGGGTITAALRR